MTQVNKKAKTSPIGCNWVFTWNNYNDKKAPQAWPDMAQLVYQCEICPQHNPVLIRTTITTTTLYSFMQ